MSANSDYRNAILCGDAFDTLRRLPSGIAQTCVTSPPFFGLRDYGVNGQIGLEASPEEYVAKLTEVFREVRRALRPDGTLWLNLGDSYAGSWGNYAPRGIKGIQRAKNGGDRWQRPAYSNTTFLPPTAGVPGLKPKDLCMIPSRVALALQADGWYLRAECVWAKPNAMPESVRDRPTRSHEMLYLLAKSERYYYDSDAVREPTVAFRSEGPSAFRGQATLRPRGRPTVARAASLRRSGNKRRLVAADGERSRLNTHLGSSVPWEDTGRGRNKRDVWTVAVKPFAGAHFATFPPKLIEPCILAGSRPGDLVLDPFAGSGTVGLVAHQHGRDYLLIDLNPAYCDMARERIHGKQPTTDEEEVSA